MESPNPEPSAGAKRKRTPIPETASAPAIHPGPTTVTQINYLARASAEKLKLIEGDAETFGDVLSMIDDYEGECRWTSRDWSINDRVPSI
jgi:hypothetical protein